VRLRRSGDAPPVTATTLSRIRATLRAALNAAIRRGLISDNPASRAELPRARRPRAVVWTPERVGHWQRTGEHPPVAVWTVAQTAQFLQRSGATSGQRIAEQCSDRDVGTRPHLADSKGGCQ
jgi:hypothetical protein